MAKSHKPSSNSNKKEVVKRNGSGKDRSAVVSLTQFAHHKSKGTKKAIEHYRNKQQSKFNRRAGLLRQYKKAMKSEGFDAGVGGSRKRVPDGEGSSSEDVTNTDADPQDVASTKSNTRKGRAKADPFFKSKQKAQKSKEEKLQRQRDAEEWKDQKEIKLKKRAQRSKLMSKRTRKGQPVMRNMIESMLEKIKRDE